MRIHALVATEHETTDGRRFSPEALLELSLKTTYGTPVNIEFDPERPIGYVLMAQRTEAGVEIEADVPDETPEGFLVPHVQVRDDARPVRSISAVIAFALTGFPADPTLTKWINVEVN